MFYKDRVFLLSFSLILSILLLFGTIAIAEDVKGAKDHPLITRFPGSEILFYHEVSYDEYYLVLGPVEWERDADQKLVSTIADGKWLEGKITRIQYEAPEGHSTLEIFRSYENALKDAGFEILFSGSRDELGRRFGNAIYNQDIFSAGLAGGFAARGRLSGYLQSQEEHQRYLAAKLSGEGKDSYVSLFTSISVHKPEPAIQLDVVEVQSMEEGLVTADVVTASDLLAEIDRTGKALVYGIYFETGSYQITTDSEPTLEEIALFLEENPDIRLYVTGHTDDTGDYEYNVNLSRQRAQSVAEWLIDNYVVDSNRLHPVGVGPVAPVASNETEPGRSQNRRVELVKRL
jgi:outer membrane protein OmpA-like peptidoglycan-associated protein